MPTLTAITETKRGRYALFFDGEFAFSLDEDTFAACALHAGDELTEAEIYDLRQKSDARRALDKAMDLLALRDHAAGELYQKLCRKFDPHTAAAAVAKTGELGLLDDAGFARRRAAELLRKRKSRREILQDLAAKGVKAKRSRSWPLWPAAASPTASSRPRWGKRWKNWKWGMGNEERPRPGRCFHTGKPRRAAALPARKRTFPPYFCAAAGGAPPYLNSQL